MSVTVKGADALHARLRALKPDAAMMRHLAIAATEQQKRLVPRKTGNLGRSIGVERVTARSADTVARAGYAAAVEYGTRPHVIQPRLKKALRFASGGGARLSGTPRTGAAVTFAKKVNHPGTRAQPYMIPGAQRALKLLGVDTLVKRWNKAG